jgi:3-isopropylmalate/(R)-2-methylmalate dehydratase small subunit
MNVITGKVWKFGDNIDTDLIIPARYLNTSNPHELAKYAMADADPEFANKVQPGDIIVAGYNFGSGSSREHAPIALKAVGVGAVIAKSFARIFYRNSFNMGLPIFEVLESDEINEGDLVKIDLDNGTIENFNTKKVYNFQPIPEFMQELIATGGLINYAREEIAQGNNNE